jgi:hypothetical protein
VSVVARGRAAARVREADRKQDAVLGASAAATLVRSKEVAEAADYRAKGRALPDGRDQIQTIRGPNLKKMPGAARTNKLSTLAYKLSQDVWANVILSIQFHQLLGRDVRSIAERNTNA